MVTFLLIVLFVFILYKLINNGENSQILKNKLPKRIKYKCQDCGHSFSSTQNVYSCPNCSSNIIDELATMAGIYMLGDWLGVWGNESENLGSNSDPFSDPFEDELDPLDEGDDFSDGFGYDDFSDEYEE